MNRVQRGVEELPQEEAVESSNHYFATEEILDLSKYRQLLLLLYSIPEIPLAIWVVVYVSAFVFTALMVFHVGTRGNSRGWRCSACRWCCWRWSERWCCSTRPTSVWALRCGRWRWKRH